MNFENSAKPRVGDWVIAVGNPFGLGGTATAGIISAYGRDIGETFVDYIQIDAPINRGNSGGPTFDIYGRVIGVNTAIFSPSGGSVGIGFAIPADVADGVTKQLISGGKITAAISARRSRTVSPRWPTAQGLGDAKGAIVADLVPGGPAAAAGLLPATWSISVNGQPVTTSSELTREVAKAHAGDALRWSSSATASARPSRCAPACARPRRSWPPTTTTLAAGDRRSLPPAVQAPAGPRACRSSRSTPPRVAAEPAAERARRGGGRVNRSPTPARRVFAVAT